MRVALLLGLVAVLSGCGANPNRLTFRSNQTGEIYPQTFRRAFYTQSEDGRYDVVLIEDGIMPAQRRGNGPLVSSAAGPLSQTVQIRVLWKPLRMTRPDAPSATNSVIDWYVQTTDGDRLHYRGAGFVAVSEGKNGAKFTIRNAHVQLSEGAGRLHDPLGASSLSGTFVAIRNEGVVSSTIELLHGDNGRQARQASALDGPPPRPPGP